MSSWPMILRGGVNSCVSSIQSIAARRAAEVLSWSVNFVVRIAATLGILSLNSAANNIASAITRFAPLVGCRFAILKFRVERSNALIDQETRKSAMMKLFVKYVEPQPTTPHPTTQCRGFIQAPKVAVKGCRNMSNGAQHRGKRRHRTHSRRRSPPSQFRWPSLQLRL